MFYLAIEDSLFLLHNNTTTPPQKKKNPPTDMQKRNRIST